MNNLNSEKTRVINQIGERHNKEKETKILIVEECPALCQQLVKLINCQSNLTVSGQVKNVDQAVNAIKQKQVDFAILSLTPSDMAKPLLAEKIKLIYPNLPLLILSVPLELITSKDIVSTDGKEIVNQQTIEQIRKAIDYIRTLLANRVFGFTVLVKIERSSTLL